MSDCVISVIIPVFNEERYLERTLRCFADQCTEIPFEVIVCDNNSTDQSMAIAAQYTDCIVCEHRQGIAPAMNTAARHAQGPYLIFADADTLYPADFIEKTYRIFAQEKYVGFYGGKYCYDETDGNLKPSLRLKIAHLCYGLCGSAPVARLLEKCNALIVPGFCLCTPRRVFDAVGGFDENTKAHEDVAYSWKIRRLGQKKFIDDLQVRSSLRRAERGLLKLIPYHFNVHNMTCLYKGLRDDIGMRPARQHHE